MATTSITLRHFARQTKELLLAQRAYLRRKAGSLDEIKARENELLKLCDEVLCQPTLFEREVS